MRVLRRVSRGGNGKPGGILRFWVLWEALNRPRSRPIRPGSVVRYRLSPHHGPTVRLKDGAVIRRGDPIIELHLDNLTLMGQARGGPFDPFVTLQHGVDDLRVLARQLIDGTLPGPVRALHGFTPFAPVLRREGFELHPVRHTSGARLTRMYMAGLIALYHPDGWLAVSPDRASRWPGEVWMSADRFLKLGRGTNPD